MVSWQEWEADRKAKTEAVKAHPCYGGNKIPKSYLNAHNKKVAKAIAKQGGFEYVEQPEGNDEVPEHIARFARLI